MKENKKSREITKYYAVGTAVVINYGKCGCLSNCFVYKVKVGIKSITYDIKIYPFLDNPDDVDVFFIMKDIDEHFIELPFDRFQGKSNMPLDISES